MLRDLVAPGLRELGFTGSGKRFALRPATENGDFGLLGIRGWPYNDATLARFTLNVAFYTAEEWALAQATAEHNGLARTVPSPNEQYFCGWTTRVGYLYEPGHDHWWGVRDEADAQLVAADVIRVVRTYVVPQLTARLNRQNPPSEYSDGHQSERRCEWPYCYANDEFDDEDWDA
jgi:hypothetical protein